MISPALAFMDYFILKPDGEQTGTFSIDQIRAMLNTGFIGLDTRYWHEGISDWQPIDRIEESLNFPEHNPAEPHHTPPPIRRLSGSLARAIPSPHQQKRLATSSAPAPAAAPPDKPIAPVVPDVPRRNGEISAPATSVASGIAAENSSAPATVVDEPALPVPPKPVAVDRPKRAWLNSHLLRTFAIILLALAIIAAIVASRHPAKSPLSKITLTSRNVYVLLDQASIKTFEDDMRDSPVADSLRTQIAQATDPLFVQRMTIGLEKESVRHSGEITQQYIQGGKAQFVEAGTYSALAYFDDNGVLVVPRAGLPWVAISYRGNIVYAYLGGDLALPEP